MAGHDLGNGLSLYRRRLGVAGIGNRLEYGGVQIQIFK